MTASALGVQLQTLREIFTDHFFTIPDYQRGYAWDEKQIREMLFDIEHLLNDGVERRHFTGTLVLSPAAKSSDEYDVVDGQQRLTTLVILLGQLLPHLPPNQQAAFRELYLRRGTPGNEYSVLQVNTNSRFFFERVILEDGDTKNEKMPLRTHHRLVKARSIINDWMTAGLKAGITARKLRETVETELGFLVYAPKDDSEIGIMFEVINNRGKALSELEKVKNYLIYCCAKLGADATRCEVNKDWSTILTNLSSAKKTSLAEEGAFLRYCMVVHFKLSKGDSQHGYDQLKKKLSKDTDRRKVISLIESFVRFLRLASLWYARLYGRNFDGVDRALVPVLEQIRAQDRHASIMPLVLALVVRNAPKRERLVDLLQLMEKLNFRVYMARNMMPRNDSGQAELYAHAAKYYHGELVEQYKKEASREFGLKIKSNEDALEYYLVWFSLYNSPDEKFEQSLFLEKDSNDDFYSWRGLRYLLMSYEQHLQPNKTVEIDKITRSRSEGKSADYLSIEHFWATEYRKGAGENVRPSDNHERRRLGNFVLLELRLNIQGRNESVDNKITRYVKGIPDDNGNYEPPSDLEQVRRLAKDAERVCKRHAGDPRTKNYFRGIFREINDRQEKRFVSFALERWSLEKNLGYAKFIKWLEGS